MVIGLSEVQFGLQPYKTSKNSNGREEGTITECFFVNEEASFFLILLLKRARLLARDWSSGCVATAYAIEKLFFCKNGLSFRDI